MIKKKIKFIIGYRPKDFGKKLTQFSSEKEADFEAEEWVSIKAVSLKEAKKNYEKAFLKWQRGFKKVI